MQCSNPNCQNEGKPKYCGTRCAALVNSKIQVKRPRTSKRWGICDLCNQPVIGKRHRLCKSQNKESCSFCNSPLNKGASYFCSHECQHLAQAKLKIATGKCSVQTAKLWLRYLNNACSVCSNSTWNDKVMPLEIDHIDGNSTNNSIGNLRLICPNCHAQTETYKGKNKGRGRHFRTKRYHDGKSY